MSYTRHSGVVPVRIRPLPPFAQASTSPEVECVGLQCRSRSGHEPWIPECRDRWLDKRDDDAVPSIAGAFRHLRLARRRTRNGDIGGWGEREAARGADEIAGVTQGEIAPCHRKASAVRVLVPCPCMRKFYAPHVYLSEH